MKRTLSLVLALVMVLGSFSTVFAAGTSVEEKAAAFLKEKEVLVGNAEGNLMLGEGLKRQDAVILLSKLMGEFDEASSTTGNPTYKDIRDKFYLPFLAWAQANGTFVGHNNDKFGFGEFLTAQEYASVLLRVLGYEVEWKNTLEEAKALGLLADVNVENSTKITRGQMSVMTVNALGTEMKDSKVTLAEKLEIEMPQPAKLEVKEAKVSTAKSFLVVFNKAVEDTSKIEFSAKRGSVEAKVTVKWNEAKTEATLEAAAKLAEGDYTVTVTDKTAETAVEMGKFELKIEKEKVVSVEFDSDVIVRINDEEGVVGYVVKNQYGENITDAALGRGLDWIVSTNGGYIRDPKAGVLTVKHTGQVFNQLKDLKTVTVTVRDISTGFVVTKSFGVSETVSVVSDIKLLGIVDEKGKEVDFIFDPTKTYYLAYEAFDSNGKKIDYFAALNSKLYEVQGQPNSGTKVLDVRSTNDVVTPKLETHPDTNKAVYRLELDGSKNVTFDTPVSFVAMAPFTGKTSTLNTTLLRRARVETFSMQTPVETVSQNKTTEIPFTAFDQNGKEVTMFDDLNNRITFSSANVGFVRQGDGTAKLFGTFSSKGIVYITATVDGSLKGSFSQISIDVKETAYPASIESLRHTRAYTNLNGAGSSMTVYLSDLAVKDQYDRDMNLEIGNSAYRVVVGSSNPAIVSVTGSTLLGNTDAEVKFTGGTTYGTATITYTLEYNDNGTWKYVDSASAIAYNVDPKEIRSAKLALGHTNELYVLEKSPLYASATNTATGVGGRMRTNLTVYGVLESGMEVRLPSAMVGKYTTTNGAFDINSSNQVKVFNIGNATTASTTVTGYVYGTGRVYSDSATINANTAAPAPKAVNANYENALLRVANIENDVITLSATEFNNHIANKSVFAWDNSTGNAPSVPAADVYFTVNTQYGMSNSGLVQRVIASTVNGTNTISVDQNTGEVTVANSVASGDQFTITAIAANGMTKTITIKVMGN